MIKKRRVVVTGLGVVAPNGIGKDSFWEANVNGKSGVSNLKTFDVSSLESKIAAQVEDFNSLDYMSAELVRRVDRYVQLSLASAKMAVEDSGLDLNKENRNKIGVIVGSALGGLLFHEEQILKWSHTGLAHPLSAPKITPNAIAAYLAMEYKLFGVNAVIASACASGNCAIGEAYKKIYSNEADVIFSGGTEAPLTGFSFSGYNSLKVLSVNNFNPTKASRPFDKERDGFVLGEGSAVLILEELEHALKRKAHIYAEIVGYSCTSGAYHIVSPQPDGEDAVRAMDLALKNAKVNKRDIDYINAHGTSTQPNDKIETLAIKKTFGDWAYKIPISSTKSMIGHTIGAAGAIEAIVCCLAIKNNVVPPTINYEFPDSQCDLDYVPNSARSKKVKTVLSNSFGFGSVNSCLVFKKY